MRMEERGLSPQLEANGRTGWVPEGVSRRCHAALEVGQGREIDKHGIIRVYQGSRAETIQGQRVQLVVD